MYSSNHYASNHYASHHYAQLQLVISDHSVHSVVSCGADITTSLKYVVFSTSTVTGGGRITTVSDKLILPIDFKHIGYTTRINNFPVYSPVADNTYSFDHTINNSAEYSVNVSVEFNYESSDNTLYYEVIVPND